MNSITEMQDIQILRQALKQAANDEIDHLCDTMFATQNLTLEQIAASLSLLDYQVVEQLVEILSQAKRDVQIPSRSNISWRQQLRRKYKIILGVLLEFYWNSSSQYSIFSKPVYIFGLAKSGTEWLSKMLASFPLSNKVSTLMSIPFLLRIKRM